MFPRIGSYLLPWLFLGSSANCNSTCNQTSDPDAAADSSTATDTAPPSETGPADTGIQTPDANQYIPTANALITWQPTFEQEMDGHDSRNWEMASWSNNSADSGEFGCTWQQNNISFADSIMSLTLDNLGCPNSCDGHNYASGEYRSRVESFSYGYYEVRMQAAQGSGLLSSFFVYAGVYGTPSHQEIDAPEILGRNCDQAELNLYVEGRGRNQENKMIVPLGFNACEGFHNYGFLWSEERLVFYIDGVEIHRVEENPDTPEREIPFGNTRIMANFWTARPGSGSQDWIGRLSYTHPESAQYDWIRFATLESAEAGRRQPTPPPIAPQAIIAQNNSNIFTATISRIVRSSHASGDIPVIVYYNVTAAPADTSNLELFLSTNNEYFQASRSWSGPREYSFNAHIWSGHNSILGQPAGSGTSITTILRAIDSSDAVTGENREDFSLDRIE